MIFILVGLFFIGMASAAVPEHCDPSMVGYWNMDGNADDSIGGNDGAGYIESIIPFSQVGTAADFGGSDLITIPSFTEINFTSNFTIEFWINKRSSPASVTDLITKGTAYGIRYDGNTDNLNYYIGAESIISSIPVVVGDNTYVSLVYVDFGGTRTLNTYIDGIDVGSLVLSSSVSLSPSDLIIGNTFRGWIDEVAMYDRALTAAEITAHYDLSSAGNNYCPGIGDSGGSSTDTEFTIEGCYLPSGEGIISGSCSTDGFYYCPTDSTDEQSTLDDVEACSKGSSSIDPGNTCCPSGYVCSSESFKCEQCINDCPEENETTTDKACSVYNSRETCLNDTEGLGQIGIGTDVCGTTIYDNVTLEPYSIPRDSCRCEWEDIDGPGGNGKVCVLAYNVTQQQSSVGTQNEFTCFKDFSVNKCIKGVQGISWSVNSSIYLNGDFIGSGVPDNILASAGCLPGNRDRDCGAPVIRLPGFSLFSFILSVSVIGMFYYRREKWLKI